MAKISTGCLAAILVLTACSTTVGSGLAPHVIAPQRLEGSAARDRAGGPPANWAGLRTRGTQIVDRNGNTVVLKGFGPGEWTNTEAYMIRWPDEDPGNGKHPSQYGYTAIHATLDGIMSATAAARFWQMWQANDVTEADFARMQSWGANSLRLSINYHWLSPAQGEYAQGGWRWLDRVVSWGRSHGIRIIFCLHAAPGAQSPYLMADTPDVIAHLWTQPAIYQPWTIELWRAIARRYSDEPFVAGYDLLDEPIPPKGHDGDVRPFYREITQAIRAVDRNHIIFVEGLHFAGNTAGMRAMLPPWDSNMVLVFHKYWDRNDRASIAGYLDIRHAYGLPIWNGETGENSPAWLHSMVALLERNGIGWNSWTYKKLDDSGSSAYSIRIPDGYDRILRYVRCLTPTYRNCQKPTQAQADATMLQLGSNDATENGRFEPAVVHALFDAHK